MMIKKPRMAHSVIRTTRGESLISALFTSLVARVEVFLSPKSQAFRRLIRLALRMNLSFFQCVHDALFWAVRDDLTVVEDYQAVDQQRTCQGNGRARFNPSQLISTATCFRASTCGGAWESALSELVFLEGESGG